MDDETRLVPAHDRAALVKQKRPRPFLWASTSWRPKVIAALDVLAAIIPDLRTPHPATVRKVRGARTIPREAVSSIVAMTDASPFLQAMKEPEPE